MAVQEADAPLQDRTAFLEELIVRRELAVNFVRYNSNCCRSQVRFAWIESRMSGASQQHSDTADTHHSNSADGVSLTPLVQEFGTRSRVRRSGEKSLIAPANKARLHHTGKISIIIDLQGVTLWGQPEVS